MNNNERTAFFDVSDWTLFRVAVQNTSTDCPKNSIRRSLMLSEDGNCFFVHAIETRKEPIDMPLFTSELDRLLANLATLKVEYKIISFV